MYRHVQGVHRDRPRGYRGIAFAAVGVPFIAGVALTAAVAPRSYADPSSAAAPGLYSLQALIDFDELIGASIDAHGRISLVGRRSADFQRIPYLDHLATALESADPTFSLEWTTESEAQVDRAFALDEMTIVNRLAANVMRDDGTLTAIGAWLYAEVGVTAHLADPSRATRTDVIAGTYKVGGNLPAAKFLAEWYDSILLNPNRSFVDIRDLSIDHLGMADELKSRQSALRARTITEDQFFDWFWPVFWERVGTILRSDGSAYARLYRNSRAEGRTVIEAFTASAAKLEEEVKTTLVRMQSERLFGRTTPLVFPPFVMRMALGIAPRVRPLFRGLEPRSRLARISFDADYLMKGIDSTPGLKAIDPQYRTLWEYAGETSLPDSVRCWLAPDPRSVVVSSDGTGIGFPDFSLRFMMEERLPSGAGRRHETLAAYAADMTSRMATYQKAFPVLRELREAMKCMEVARWLRGKNARLRLPAEGRDYDDPPAEVDGIVYYVWRNGARGPTGYAIASGGVDLRPQARPQVAAESNDAIRLLRGVPTEQPGARIRSRYPALSEVPFPDIPGWVAGSRQGHQLRSRVGAVVVDLQIDPAYSAALATKMRELELEASLLDAVDAELNAAKSVRLGTMPTLTESGEKLRVVEEGLRREAADAAVGLLGDAHKLLQIRTKVWTTGTVRRELLEALPKVASTMEALAEAPPGREGLSIEQAAEKWEEVIDLVQGVKELWDDMPPETLAQARRSAGAASLSTKYVFGLGVIRQAALWKTWAELAGGVRRATAAVDDQPARLKSLRELQEGAMRRANAIIKELETLKSRN